MRICKLAAHACIRVQKMALPLMARGHKVYLVSQRRPSYAEAYDGFSECFSIEQMRNMVIQLSEWADVFHCHNEPSWFVTLCKEICPETPVILDVHDSFLARSTPDEYERALKEGKPHLRVSVEERNNFQLADALVFPSQPFADIILDEFNLKQPCLILPSYLPQNFYNYQGKEWFGGIVYEGRIDLKEKVKDSKASTGFQYSDLEEFARQCKELGVDFHFYGREDDDFKKAFKPYEREEGQPGGMTIHGAVPYPKLMGALSQHDWGFVGNTFYTPEWEVALPNKLFEYIAAAVPVFVMNAKHCSEFVEEYGVGITVDSVEEITKRWKEHTKIRKNLIKVRTKFVMEKHIRKLENLYRSLL